MKNTFQQKNKRQSLVRLFGLSTLYSFVIFFLITGLSLFTYQYKSIANINSQFNQDQLMSLKFILKQYIDNRVTVLKDIASLPVIQRSLSSEGIDKNRLMEFLVEFKILGNKGSKVLLDSKKEILYSSEHLSLDDVAHMKNLNLIYLDKIDVHVLFINNKQVEFIVPIEVDGVFKGAFIYLEEFPMQEFIGDSNNISVQLESSNKVKISSEDFDVNSSDIISVTLEEYGMSLTLTNPRKATTGLIEGAAINLFLSLLLGCFLSTALIFIYGRKYFIEPFERLDKLESQLELALDASGVGTWLWDLKTNVIKWDPYSYKVFGVNHLDFHNNYESFSRLILDEDRMPLEREIQKCLEQNLYLDTEFRIKRGDNGEVRNIAVKGRILLDDKFEPISMTGVNFDITKLKVLANKLEISEYELKKAYQEIDMILDALPAFIFYKDGNNNILRANKFAADSLGLKKEDLTNQPTSKYYPDLAEKYLIDDREVINTGVAKLAYVEEYVPLSGKKSWIRTSKIPLISNQSQVIDSLLVMATDITEEIEAQNLIKQKSVDLEKSNKSLQEFAYFVSHDLQEPIRTVSSFVELLIKHLKLNHQFDEKANLYSNYIIDSSKRMRDMIQDILAYSKVGSGGDLIEIDLNKVISDIALNLNNSIEERKVEIQSDSLPTITARRFEMIQLFQNFISNSIKFTPLERIPKIEIRFYEDEEFYNFSIKDNGIGIKEEDHQKIFTIFQRIENEYKEGTGVGLAICNKIVEAYAGHISVNSKFGEWTEFCFSIKK